MSDNTQDLSKFGYRELSTAADLLNEKRIEHNIKEDNIMPSSQEITELIDSMNGKIIYFQTVRERATSQIRILMDHKTELIDTYRNNKED